MGVGGQRRVPTTLLPGKTLYPLYRRLGGTHGWSGQVRKILPPPGFDPQNVQPVTSRYTNCATLAFITYLGAINYAFSYPKGICQ